MMASRYAVFAKDSLVLQLLVGCAKWQRCCQGTLAAVPEVLPLGDAFWLAYLCQEAFNHMPAPRHIHSGLSARVAIWHMRMHAWDAGNTTM